MTHSLRVLAEQATPGPWHTLERCDNAGPDEACGVTSIQRTTHGHIVGIFRSDAYDECSHPVSAANAAFIAACSPDRILALLDQLEAANPATVAAILDRLEACERERDAARVALDEREADMHVRIRLGYDKTVADTWRAEVERITAERDEARRALREACRYIESETNPDEEHPTAARLRRQGGL